MLTYADVFDASDASNTLFAYALLGAGNAERLCRMLTYADVFSAGSNVC
jgi:hypothetical protein